MSETSDVTRPLIEALNSMGCFAVRVHAGRFALRRGYMHAAPKGTPDIHATINGRSVWIETKSADGQLAPAQLRIHRYIRASGGFVYIVRSVHEGVTCALEVMRG